MIATEPDDIDDMLNAMLRETDCDRSGDLSDKLVKASMTYSRGEIVVALAITLAALVDQCPSPPLMLDLAVRLAERFLEVGE
jgi:hypothetical protein